MATTARGHEDLAHIAATTHGHGEGLLHSAALSQRRYLDEDFRNDGTAIFPTGHYDEDRQQIDLRETNSWRLRLHEVETPELLEVQLVERDRAVTFSTPA